MNCKLEKVIFSYVHMKQGLHIVSKLSNYYRSKINNDLYFVLTINCHNHNFYHNSQSQIIFNYQTNCQADLVTEVPNFRHSFHFLLRTTYARRFAESISTSRRPAISASIDSPFSNFTLFLNLFVIREVEYNNQHVSCTFSHKYYNHISGQRNRPV